MHLTLLALVLWPALCTATEFPDSSLTAQVRRALGKEYGALRPDDFDGLLYLEADRRDITRIDGIARLHDLKLLQLTTILQILHQFINY